MGKNLKKCSNVINSFFFLKRYFEVSLDNNISTIVQNYLSQNHIGVLLDG